MRGAAKLGWTAWGALALAASGCLAPAIAPIHPMVASSVANAGDKEIATTLGYAPAPGGGLGDSDVPGTPYADGELRWAVHPDVQLIGGLGLTFQRYFLPWPSSAALGAKLTVYEEDRDALAIAPRVVGATALNVLPSDPSNSGKQTHSIFGTRSLGFELPVLATHTFENGWALTLQGWGRYHLVRQEDASADSSGTGSSSGLGPVIVPVETGHVWGAGGALQFSFPKIRGSLTHYHAFLGVERLWLTQTSTTTEQPLIHLSRNSLVLGLGTTTPW